MALMFNGNMYRSVGVKHYGAGAVLSSIPNSNQSNFNHTNANRNLTAGEGITNDLVGVPSGYRHPAAWIPPQKPGLLSARNVITGSGTLTATAQSGRNIEASISGSGGISNAPLGLIISIAATITGSGGVSAATATALANMVAELTGSGDIEATAAGLADLGAVLVGSGAVTANNTALMDIAATIVGYGELTPEGLRDAVWRAVLTEYPDDGTAGKTLTLAGAGGVDYNLLAEAVWEYATRTLTADSGITVDEIMTDPRMLTVAKFLGLK